MTTTAPPDRECPVCGRRHQTWRKVAECKYKPLWAAGSGPWASVSYCSHTGGGDTTVCLFPTRAEAEDARRQIDRTGCGGCCVRYHRVESLED